MSETLPARPLSDDVVDRIAAEIGIQVAYHIETMYPAAAEAVAWNSAKRSIQGVVRNAVAAAGRAAEIGDVDQWIRQSRMHRIALNRLRTAPLPTDPFPEGSPDPAMPAEMPERVATTLGRDERTSRAVYRAIREALLPPAPPLPDPEKEKR
jgi:hypothetical protein